MRSKSRAVPLIAGPKDIPRRNRADSPLRRQSGYDSHDDFLLLMALIAGRRRGLFYGWAAHSAQLSILDSVGDSTVVAARSNSACSTAARLKSNRRPALRCGMRPAFASASSHEAGTPRLMATRRSGTNFTSGVVVFTQAVSDRRCSDQYCDTVFLLGICLNWQIRFQSVSQTPWKRDILAAACPWADADTRPAVRRATNIGSHQRRLSL